MFGYKKTKFIRFYYYIFECDSKMTIKGKKRPSPEEDFKTLLARERENLTEMKAGSRNLFVETDNGLIVVPHHLLGSVAIEITTDT